ncbi:hypothetical protein MMA231_03223 [Asticcacaulis sp. MM231]|uniref:ribosomal maturation YjgA family protein n=1 Tax=Asticcacaulis sp. MM231 TaxID=3157666 RepID=UPI0032D588E0
MHLRLPYALAALVVFVTEIGIALYVHDAVIRPYIGDSLAVVLVYLSLRAVTPMSVFQALSGALVFAFAIEFGQMFHLIDRLGLRGNRIAGFILGGYFDMKDLAAYVAGAVAALLVESLRKQRTTS